MSASEQAGVNAAEAAWYPANGITVPYRARFDECGPDGIVRTSSLLRYAQDIAWIHSEGLGFTRAWYAERNLAWVVRSAELVILAQLPLGGTIALSTAPTGFRRVWGRRRTEGRLDDGTLALWGHTDWVMTDTVRGIPGRIPQEFPAAFALTPGTFDPVRVELPAMPEGAPSLRTAVRPQDIDPMGHVNNAAYLDYLEEALLAAGADGGAGARAIAAIPRRILVEYVAAASPGAILTGTAWRIEASNGGGWAWSLADEGGRELARARIRDHGGAVT